MSLSITCPFPPDELSPNGRPHWAARARATAFYRDACRVSALQAVRQGPQESWPTMPLRVPVAAIVTFTVARKGHDGDNLMASIKALWDGLRDAGVLASDTAEALHINYTVEIGKPQAVKVMLAEVYP